MSPLCIIINGESPSVLYNGSDSVGSISTAELDFLFDDLNNLKLEDGVLDEAYFCFCQRVSPSLSISSF